MSENCTTHCHLHKTYKTIKSEDVLQYETLLNMNTKNKNQALTCQSTATSGSRQFPTRKTQFFTLRSVLQKKISIGFRLQLHGQANAKSRCGSNIFLCFCTKLRLVAQ